jgi:hypothetical protein
MYVSTVTANHIGFMIRAGGENKIDHTRLTLEYDYVPKTQSLNVSIAFLRSCGEFISGVVIMINTGHMCSY